MRIRNNIPGMRGLRYGKELNSKTSKVLEKLSSGYCINRAGDDAAGLAVSERIRVNLTGYDRCRDNVREGIDLANTADAALQEVNDMLCRANELCVAAANGTYGEQERDQLLDELYALYDEMDRIFESSTFNDTKLFRHEDGDYSNGEFEYIETVIEVPADDFDSLPEWGALGISSKKFDYAVPAKGATATLTMDGEVQSAADLVGKSFSVNGYTVAFTNGTDSFYEYSTEILISVADCDSVQSAFDKLCEATAISRYWQERGIVLDAEKTVVNGNQVTLAFEPITLESTENLGYEVLGGNGTKANDVSVQSVQDELLKQMDESGDNRLSVSSTFKLLPGRGNADVLTVEDKKYLRNNYIAVNYNGIYFAGTGTRHVNLDDITTVGDLRDAVAAAMDSITDVSVSEVAADGTITVTTSKYVEGTYIYEGISYGTDSKTVQTSALSGVGVTVSKPAGTEQKETTMITLPDSFPSGTNFSLSINGTTYCFYDKDLLEEGFKETSYYSVDTNGKTADQIRSQILAYIRSEYSGEADVAMEGSRIVVTAKGVNKQLNVSVSGVDGSFESHYESKHMLLDEEEGSYDRFYHEYSVDFDIATTMGGDPTNVEALDGCGFKLNGTWYQLSMIADPIKFTDQATGVDAEVVDISWCNSYEDIANALTGAIADGTAVFADGVLTVSGRSEENSWNAMNFRDGYEDGKDGLFNNVAGTTKTENIAGGTMVTQPSATIDFSGYNAENFSELYGKGFRVTCASCENEYFNVIFCYDKEQCKFPASFDTTIDGQNQTIYNLVVELKDMQSGDEIVDTIVDQLQDKLDHYTGVSASGAVLQVFDKRRGDLIDVDGAELRAEIKSGVVTNCIYTVEANFHARPDAMVGDIKIDYRNVQIFANAESGEQYINIHLPYLTLKNLKLNPPEPDFSTPEKALETMERVLIANNAISAMRGRIGADSNRLEHAQANLSQSETQAADAYSRIRDTDIAKAMTEQVKLSIMQSAQQAAQAHAIELPNQILQLLQ